MEGEKLEEFQQIRHDPVSILQILLWWGGLLSDVPHVCSRGHWQLQEVLFPVSKRYQDTWSWVILHYCSLQEQSSTRRSSCATPGSTSTAPRTPSPTTSPPSTSSMLREPSSLSDWSLTSRRRTIPGDSEMIRRWQNLEIDFYIYLRYESLYPKLLDTANSTVIQSELWNDFSSKQ